MENEQLDIGTANLGWKAKCLMESKQFVIYMPRMTTLQPDDAALLKRRPEVVEQFARAKQFGEIENEKAAAVLVHSNMWIRDQWNQSWQARRVEFPDKNSNKVKIFYKMVKKPQPAKPSNKLDIFVGTITHSNSEWPSLSHRNDEKVRKWMPTKHHLGQEDFANLLDQLPRIADQCRLRQKRARKITIETPRKMFVTVRVRGMEPLYQIAQRLAQI
ncbi:unnamed protein product [Caenorhabditis sp. 36 PRJEB53466]|nr:unnamed protein product [Caenorhabditis sp. 36 PRJEB53466]